MTHDSWPITHKGLLLACRTICDRWCSLHRILHSPSDDYVFGVWRFLSVWERFISGLSPWMQRCNPLEGDDVVGWKYLGAWSQGFSEATASIARRDIILEAKGFIQVFVWTRVICWSKCDGSSTRIEREKFEWWTIHIHSQRLCKDFEDPQHHRPYNSK